jgi:hypothetical protein
MVGFSGKLWILGGDIDGFSNKIIVLRMGLTGR